MIFNPTNFRVNKGGGDLACNLKNLPTSGKKGGGDVAMGGT